MLKGICKTLENPHHPLLGPTLFGLEKWGMWQPKKGIISTVYNLIHLFAILFVLSQYVELWIIRSNLELALKNLSISMLSTVCVVKASTFVFWQKQWKSVIEYVSTLERAQLKKNDKITNNILKDYTRYSRKVTYFYWCLVAATVFAVILAPLTSYISSPILQELIRNGTVAYPEIMSSWLPFDKTKGLGYWAQVIEQSLICFYGGGIVANYDSNAVVLMTFFAGQMKLLKANCERLFEENNRHVNFQVYVDRIRECHHHHINLVKYATILNSLMSPVMFLYVIICSLMICSSAVQLTTDSTTRMHQIWIAEYLLALIAQLFLYCWHSNEVSLMSLCIDDGVYKSAWWTQNVPIRRKVLLLSGKFRKNIVFTAGPFTTLSVPTFIAILRASYSFYTLLSKKG
ncbi:unnamed protein product [Parnassius mnemosyne]|uniref:Odorant receptor n=1 Tax=Parnassius mnemosyne TaxID=213953 RepID=A0AAV1LFC9_9NEOP